MLGVAWWYPAKDWVREEPSLTREKVRDGSIEGAPDWMENVRVSRRESSPWAGPKYWLRIRVRRFSYLFAFRTVSEHNLNLARAAAGVVGVVLAGRTLCE